ncbi:MAG TPA: nitrate reductase [Flexistipes sinusarabici]|uniref:Nitrate reductase n=1 Tax=Flexistipes sinusarabici TaxID=2352 RepID=A0A3D5QBJ3_FLESI|nr:nitrate reductase [Flexistipes sinusarabici]
MKISFYRRIVQLIVLIGIFVIPLLNILEIYFIKGTFYSIDVGDVAMADPLAVFQSVITSETINTVMLISVIIPVLLAMFFGRVWCSWFCPYHFLVEMLQKLRNLLKLKSKKPEYSENLVNRSNRIRLLFLLIGLFITGIAGIPLLNLISAPGIISSQALVLVKFHYFTFEIVFILFLLIMEFFFFYFFWCRLLCPTGIFLSLIDRKKAMKVTKIQPECSMCKSCIKSCPMVIDPMNEGKNPLCHNCGICIDACPDNKKRNTLRFKFY